MDKPKVLIAVPCMGTVGTDFFNSVIHLNNEGNTFLAIESNSLVYNARAHLTIKAIEAKADFILFIDSDQVFEPDLVERLLATAEEYEADLVTAIIFKRKFPTQPLISDDMYWTQDRETGQIDGGAHVYEDYPKDQVFEIQGCGMGCCLIRMTALQACADAIGMSPFQPLPGLSEDYSFCVRMKQLGKKMVCDSRIKVGHVGTVIFDEAVWLKQIGIGGGDKK